LVGGGNDLFIQLLHQRDISVLEHTVRKPLLEIDVVAGVLVPVDALADAQHTPHQIHGFLGLVFLFEGVRMLVVNVLELFAYNIDETHDVARADVQQLIQQA